MESEKNLSFLPVALLRMAGYPVQLMDQFRIPDEASSYAEFVHETSVIRKKLREFIKKSADIREAIWTSSERIYGDLAKKFRAVEDYGERSSADRRWEILTTKYLLRFCYKNDRTSFFGPSCYVHLSGSQSSSLEAVVASEVANRERADTYAASWANGISAELLHEYNRARGVEEKSAVLEKIVGKVKGRNDKSHWRWYNERSPVYELCPANVNVTIGGELLQDITNKSRAVGNKFGKFNAVMYETAVKNGFYGALYDRAHKRVKSDRLEDWFDFFYSDDLSFLDDIKEEMVAVGKRLFQQVFLESDPRSGSFGELSRRVISPFFSPDIMIASPSLEEVNDGNYELIIADMHGSLTSFHKPPSFYFDDVNFKKSMELLDRFVFGNVDFYFPRGLVPDRFDFPESLKVKKSVKNMKVHFENGGIYLDDPGAYVEFFYSDVLAKAVPLGVFNLGQFFPDTRKRIVVDGVILKRHSYTIESTEYLNMVKSHTGNSYEQWYILFDQTRKFFSQKGFRGVVFVKPESEYKPIAIDINNPFCCEILETYAKRSNSISIQEMLPGRDNLWLGNDRGNYTSELRLSFYEATA